MSLESKPSLASKVRAFAELLAQGRSLEAMERFYAAEVTLFENRELACAGKEQCLAAERAALAKQPEPPRIKLLKLAVDEEQGHAFLEYVARFSAADGRAMRLEQVAVQTWERGLIVEERFYYEGVVDEGDETEAGATEDEA